MSVSLQSLHKWEYKDKDGFVRLRDSIAIHAMGALIQTRGQIYKGAYEIEIAKAAYAQADAMLKERAR